MSRHSRGITANSVHGRVLLALRAGRMSYEEIVERFPNLGGGLGRIKELGHIESQSGFYLLTEAGQRACPSRRAAPLEPMHDTFWNKSKKSSQNGQGAAA